MRMHLKSALRSSGPRAEDRLASTPCNRSSRCKMSATSTGPIRLFQEKQRHWCSRHAQLRVALREVGREITCPILILCHDGYSLDLTGQANYEYCIVQRLGDFEVPSEPKQDISSRCPRDPYLGMSTGDLVGHPDHWEFLEGTCLARLTQGRGPGYHFSTRVDPPCKSR